MLEELKKALEAAKTEEEKKAVAEKFKEEIQKLSDDELDRIAGGYLQDVPGSPLQHFSPDSHRNSKTPGTGGLK